MQEIFNKDRTLKLIKGKVFIFDYIRKKFVVLTPEETVRQNIIDFLILTKKYPKSLIKLESGIKYYELNKRSDILVYDQSGHPFLLIECKAPDVKINGNVINQASIYNKIIKATFLCISNGKDTFCYKMNYEAQLFEQLNDFPDFRFH
jgi:type I site-specific restriction endonuclease